MSTKNDTLLTASLRFLIELYGWVVVWLHFGWGIAVAIIVVTGATGVTGDKKQVIVPVSGRARVIIEVVSILLSLWATFALFPRMWAIIATILHLVYGVIALKRFRWLFQQRFTK